MMDARASRPPARRRAAGERDPERTRATILEAATAEFAAKGLNGARVDDISRSSGINKRMIYYYFGDKEGLYLAVLEKVYASIRHAETGLLLDERDPAEGMRALIRFTWTYFIEHPEFLGLLVTENVNRARFLKKSAGIRDMHSPLVERIASLLQRGAQQGAFKSGVDPVQLYISIASLGFFYLSNRHTLATIFNRDLITQDALDARGEHIADVVLGYLRA